MKRSLSSATIAIGLFALSGMLYLGVWWRPSAFGNAVALTFFILGTTELLFRVVIYRLLQKRIHSSLTRYSLNKTLIFLNFTTAIVLILWIWLPTSGTVLAAYGFIAAALAFAFQDLFKDIVGGVVIIMRNLYRVGDRIAVGETGGDVIDIGMLYTTLLEITEDEPTGRLCRMPNGKVLTTDVVNYTADHSFMWDEVIVTVTTGSVWQKADQILREVIEATTRELTMAAMQELRDLQERYFLADKNTEPQVYVEIVTGGIKLSGRYMVAVRDRRTVRDTIMRTFAERLSREKQVTLV